MIPSTAPVPASSIPMYLTMSPRIRRSPFYEATVRDGVTHFTVYNKMLMPISFGNLEAELRRLMTGVAMWDVVVGAPLHRVDGGLDGAEAGHDDAQDI